jgi:DNA-directed RNA polymerase specialized sigma24 family protein
VEHLDIPDHQADEPARPRDEVHERLMNAIAQLKPRAVEILLLHDKHDYSDAHIAKLLGASGGTIFGIVFARRRGGPPYPGRP